ncbi:hypothetical protein EJ06DRAFT_559890 [Trichodelitschia bisporula]|uniref:Mid2 domain-containing protein n=1 Tax=Trichodelitschia bisporula TaxID=703511 RepID=A0A6G1HJX5_9PEZI|nr:hypothetical protein EJ06DRAFT_559890 [Trichodelitschia bisporula]
MSAGQPTLTLYFSIAPATVNSGVPVITLTGVESAASVTGGTTKIPEPTSTEKSDTRSSTASPESTSTTVLDTSTSSSAVPATATSAPGLGDTKGSAATDPDRALIGAAVGIGTFLLIVIGLICFAVYKRRRRRQARYSDLTPSEVGMSPTSRIGPPLLPRQFQDSSPLPNSSPPPDSTLPYSFGTYPLPTVPEMPSPPSSQDPRSNAASSVYPDPPSRALSRRVVMRSFGDNDVLSPELQLPENLGRLNSWLEENRRRSQLMRT